MRGADLPARAYPPAALVLGLASLVGFAAWMVVGRQAVTVPSAILFMISGLLAGVGLLAAGVQRWRGVLWSIAPFTFFLVASASLFGGLFLRQWKERERSRLFGSDGPHSGWSATWVGDANGDGTDDFLLATPFEPDGAGKHGIFRVISGRDGATLHRLRGFHIFHREVAAPAGDVDGDGCSDLLLHDRSSSETRLVSGRDAAVLCRVEDSWGSSMSTAGDLDGDGRGDVLIAHPLLDTGGRSRGEVLVVSGASGAVLRKHVGQSDWESLGWDVCDLGDVDGDSTHDYAMSTSSGWYEDENRQSFVRIHSGRSGRTIAEVRDPSFRDDIEIAPTRDVSGDGVADLLVGISHTSTLLVVSGKDGTILRSRTEPFLADFGDPGDVDGDGRPELRLSSYHESFLESSRDGSRIRFSQGQSLGQGAGDLDEDGHADLLRVTNRWLDSAPEPSEEVWRDIWRDGVVEVLSGRDWSVLLRIDASSLAPEH